MLDDTNNEKSESVTAPTSNEVQTMGLSISDLRIFKEIVVVASSRGAFKAEEFATIGDTYSRLNNFLQVLDEANTPETSDEVTDEVKVDKKTNKSKKK